MGGYAQQDARITLRNGGDGVDRRGVVGIGADENAIIRIAPAPQRMAQHRSDHVRFAPGGNEYRDPAGIGRWWQGCRRHTVMATIYEQIAPCLARQKQQVDQKIVHTADGQSNGGK